jgi:hypothetical protein
MSNPPNSPRSQMAPPPPSSSNENRHPVSGDTHGAIVKQSETLLYNEPGVEALYKIIDIHLIDYSWIEIHRAINLSDGGLKVTKSSSPSLRITSGVDVNNQWGFESAARGLQMTVNGVRKTFTDNETRPNPTPSTIKLSISPGSSVYLYQKRYRFSATIWFRLRIGGVEAFTVGNLERDGWAGLGGAFEIDSDENLISSKSLRGTLDAMAIPQADILDKLNVRRFEKCSGRCREHLQMALFGK